MQSSATSVRMPASSECLQRQRDEEELLPGRRAIQFRAFLELLRNCVEPRPEDNHRGSREPPCRDKGDRGDHELPDQPRSAISIA